MLYLGQMNENEAQLLHTLETATKHIAAAVTRCSRELRFLWTNQAYADWIQQPLNEIVDRPILEVLGKEAFEALLPHFNRVLTGETVRYEQEANFGVSGQGGFGRFILPRSMPTEPQTAGWPSWSILLNASGPKKTAPERRMASFSNPGRKDVRL